MPATRQVRVRAPELRGRGWLNTGGRKVSLADLRGRFVILDFWTFCCINCLHVLDELRPLESKYHEVLTVIGVHSPKFEHERDPAALAAAVERYGVDHPVLDDPDLQMWQQYAARAWPTLVVINPEGYVVSSMAGEGHAEGLDRLLAELIEEHDSKGTLTRSAAGGVLKEKRDRLLSFPGKAVLAPDGGLWVSDSAQHSLVELATQRRIGSGRRGREDGPADTASFSEPQGLCVLPKHEAEIAGYDLVVADTVNHLLRGVDLKTGTVRTVAGTGHPIRSATDDHAHDALAVDLSSPWDVAWFDGKVIVAMAGTHQLWWFDPIKRTAGVYAGTSTEALRDGPRLRAWLAQPSGLAAGRDRLWFVDAETSALRWVADGQVHTAAGQGLFDFGHVDGAAGAALFQHPLGVCELPDGTVAVADTYNGAIRRYDPVAETVTTLATGLAEPSDVITKGGEVHVVESAAHRVVPLTITEDRHVDGRRHRTERPPTDIGPGEVRLEVVYETPPGQKLDDTYGPPTRVEVSASPPTLLLDGAGVTTDLTRTLLVAPSVDGGVLQVIAQAATCDIEGPHAACHLTRQDWGVPVRVVEGGPRELRLILRG